MKIENTALNTLPVITWRWLKVNENILNNFKIKENLTYNKDFIKSYEISDITLKKMSSDIDYNQYLKYFNNKKEDFGVSKEFIDLAEKYYNSGIFIHIPQNIKLKDPIKIEYKIDKENPVVIDKNIIIAEENSEITIVIDYSTKDDVEAFHNGLTKIYAKKNSVINIVKLQRLNDNSKHFDSHIAFEGYGAKVNSIQIELGAEISTTNYINNLEEENSEANISSIYLADGKRYIDLSYLINHKGRRSISNIETRGALKDNAKKIFKGTLNFKKGASRSKGIEEEYAILLDKTVKADAIPLLLCEEDDVEGQHAASAGQIDSDKLFYLMSRGLDEKEAKKLIVEASFTPIIDKIPMEYLKEEITKEIHRRIVNA
ncbi:Iron-regulated ABC transporter permease protein SufD [Clostridium sp. USBA 49]|uniref:Fe-S cluster assembly protein SufD n=1 Tax=Clostridium TaxID=1485 RepID=UPI0009C47741|nr:MULTISPECIES: Fe-S cluster assembly protein SufD [Clostridium]SKA92614.1 Iron-regulated ABC transporter permease protein SufD [Clostridium sp. USBA 49]